MTPDEIAAYVEAAAKAQGLALDGDERTRVSEQFARIAAIAAPMLAVELPQGVEPAPVYRP